MMKNKTSLFSLTDLIIVVVVISIIASIIVIQQADLKYSAFVTQIEGNLRTIQAATDKYTIHNNNQLPTIGVPTETTPALIDFKKLYPREQRSIPNTVKARYWVDIHGKVWGSTLELPENIKYDGENVTWDPIKDAVEYRIYEVSGDTKVIGSTNESTDNLSKFTRTTETVYKRKSVDNFVLISAIDKYNLQTPPMGLPISEGSNSNDNSSKEENGKPIAVISVTPEQDITTSTSLKWDYSKSYDPNGDSIISAEWKNKEEFYPNAQTYVVSLRVQDEHGLWSEWVDKEVLVKSENKKPIAVISMSPYENILSNTTILWDYKESYDEDGDKIIDAEWENKKDQYEKGVHQVKLRVKDERNTWSDWNTIHFTVEEPNIPPVAVISMNPDENIDTESVIKWSTENSYDPNGDKITDSEWINKKSTYTEGNQIVKLRVKDERGAWSEWTELSLTVSKPNNKPVAVLDMNPDFNLTSKTTIEWSTIQSYDLDGDKITEVEWSNKKSVYSEGKHVVKVRVKDERGAWSDWIEREFLVLDNNRKPIADFIVNPDEPQVNKEITLDPSHSSDPDGDKIIAYDWVDKKDKYSKPGEYKVLLRVQDEHGLWSDFIEKTITVTDEQWFFNSKPVAVGTAIVEGVAVDLSKSELTVSNCNFIRWSFENSYDPNGDKIIKAEWEGTKPIYNEGIYTIRLRVMDEHGKWSDWVSYTLAVDNEAYEEPEDEEEICEEKNNGKGKNNGNKNEDCETETDSDTNENGNKYGHYKCRGQGHFKHGDECQNEEGQLVYIFTCSNENQKPIARITIDANSDKWTAKTKFEFSHENSYDPDSDKIVEAEWKNAVPKYIAGEHSVQLRVRDEKGAWSDWVSKKITISNSKPIAVIEMSPDTFVEEGENVSWSSDKSYDPDEDVIVQQVWAGKMKNYPESQAGHIYQVKLKVRDQNGEWSNWACKRVIIGDTDSDKYEECTGRSD